MFLDTAPIIYFVNDFWKVYVAYANEAGVSPGAQLFALATILFGLGLYTSLGQPNGNAEVWKERIIL